MKREQIQEWKQIGVVEEFEEIEGMITHYFIQKKRYYNEYWFIEMEVNLYSEKEREKIKVIWKKTFHRSLTYT